MRTRRRAAVSSPGSGCNLETTSIMYADETAENRPACHSKDKFTVITTSRVTHKDEGRVEILVVFFHKLPVVLLSDFVVVLVEPSFVVLLNWKHVPFHAAWRC